MTPLHNLIFCGGLLLGHSSVAANTVHTTNVTADPGAVLQFSGPATFNLDRTIDNNYGPKDWNKVTCENIKSCVSSK
jgi:hypothetical protein